MHACVFTAVLPTVLSEICEKEKIQHDPHNKKYGVSNTMRLLNRNSSTQRHGKIVLSEDRL